MELVAYTPDWLPSLTALVNDHLCMVPPGWALTEAQMQPILATPNQLWTAHYPEDGGETPPFTPIVIENDQLLAAGSGFVPNENSSDFVISWLVSAADQPTALKILLDELVRYAAAQGRTNILVCPRNGIGVGWFGIPDVWRHLVDGLKEAGCSTQDQWGIMAAVLGDLPAAPNLPEFEFAWNIKEANLEWDLIAQANDSMAGECQAWGIPAHFRGCRGFDEWITCEWVGVEEPFRRRGLACRLMIEQMRFQAQRGLRRVMLWVEVDNQPARHLYHSLGFTDVTKCWLFEKTLGQSI